jgi:hypothetical protein
MAKKRNPEYHKKKLIEALVKHYGIVTPSCNEVGISRNQYYKYLREDPEFKKQVDDINEQTLDFVEHKLLSKIEEGSERSILFYMKYKARNRGYTDSLDITSGGDKITEIKLIQVKNSGENEEDDTRD